MAYYEPKILYAINADADPKNKTVTGIDRGVALLSRQFVDRVRGKDETELLWILAGQQARTDGDETKSDLGASKWDVEQENNLVPIEADFKMIGKALDVFSEFMTELLTFRNAERLPTFQAQLAEFRAKYVGSQELVDKYSAQVFLGNSSNAQAPVVGLKLNVENKGLSEDERNRTHFCFFKDALVTLAYCEPVLSFEIKADVEPKVKVVTGASAGAPVLNLDAQATATDFLDAFWSIPAGEAKDARATFATDNNLVRVDDADVKMVSKAVKAFAEFGEQYIEFSQAGRWAKVSAAIQDFSSKHLTDAAWKAAEGELYFANTADSKVPVLSLKLCADAAPVFLYFKDAVIKSE
jgi:hypothetical protein